MKCYNCGNLMKESIELIIIKDRTIPQITNKCVKCGKAVVSIDEYEKVRKAIHPSLIERIKKYFTILYLQEN